MILIANGILITIDNQETKFLWYDIPQKRIRYGYVNDYKKLSELLNKNRKNFKHFYIGNSQILVTIDENYKLLENNKGKFNINNKKFTYLGLVSSNINYCYKF